jgi:hypothetical protein
MKPKTIQDPITDKEIEDYVNDYFLQVKIRNIFPNDYWKPGFFEKYKEIILEMYKEQDETQNNKRSDS